MLVWAFQPLPELKDQTGLVECEDSLAALLIESGKAQDPRIGATALTHIQAAPAPAQPQTPAPAAKPEPQAYDTRDMTAKPRTTPPRK
jgi:cell division septation protein DedD